MKKFAMIAAVGVCLSTCGGGGSTAPTPTIAQIAGVWRAISRVTSVTTSECVGATLAANGFVGSTSNVTAQITQNGAALSVTTTDNSTGGTTIYTGTAGASSIGLTFQSCNLCAVSRVQCSTGALRDIVPQADSITANVSGSTMTGTEAVTYNVTASGTGAAAGTMTVNGSFSATKQ